MSSVNIVYPPAVPEVRGKWSVLIFPKGRGNPFPIMVASGIETESGAKAIEHHRFATYLPHTEVQYIPTVEEQAAQHARREASFFLSCREDEIIDILKQAATGQGQADAIDFLKRFEEYTEAMRAEHLTYLQSSNVPYFGITL